MPEGDVILYFKTLFQKKYKNHRLIEIKTYKNINYPKDFKGDITKIDCFGKLLWFECDKKYYVHIHLKISGYFEFEKPEKNLKYEFVLSKDNIEKSIYLQDQRRLSEVNIYNYDEHIKILDKMGKYSIFDKGFTLEYFNNMFTKKKSICAFLLDQKYCVGVGNYMKSEVLYLSDINIYDKMNDLTKEQIELLYKNIMFVAYSNLFTYLKDDNLVNNLEKKYLHNKPKRIEVPYQLKVYQQEKTPSGQKVFKVKINGRYTFYVK